MKTHGAYKKKNEPISLSGAHSRHRKGIISPQTLQLLRLQEKVNQSDRLKNMELLQRSANVFTTDQPVFQLGSRDKKFKNDDSEFVPSKKAIIHVHEYSHANKHIKGHLNLGGTHIKVNSYISALDALTALKANSGVPGYNDMECLLKHWLESFEPTISSTGRTHPVNKKQEEEKGESRKTDRE